MVARNFGFPVFTEKDVEILNGESSRDPLGLVPIWSEVGHKLIPGLATVVSQVDGIQGILFLYACLQQLQDQKGKSVPDDKVLKLLERLWEYHLFRQKRQPCFGINSLRAADFRLSTALPGVVGTGLRQYYRGTCVNKGILMADLRSLANPFDELAKNLLNKKEVMVWLNNRLSEIRTSSKYEMSAEEEYKKLETHLKKFSKGNEPLWIALENKLIDDHGKKPWIEDVEKKYPDFNEESVHTLVVAVQDYATNRCNNKEKAKEWADQCQRILDCEPFIQLLQSVFLISQEQSRSKINVLAKRLADSAPDDLEQVCMNFQRLSFKSGRLEHLKLLAEKLQAKDFKKFLTDLLGEYYKSVCMKRGNSPIVLLDGEEIISLKPGKTGHSWKEATKPDHWGNGYFIKAQLNLYTDLRNRRRVHHD